MMYGDYQWWGGHMRSLTSCDCADMGFNIFFTVEMLLRMMGLGALPPKGVLRYFREPWNVFDGLMVACGWLQFIPEQSGKNLQSLKALRALRPLRAISRFESTKFVVRGCIAVSSGETKRGWNGWTLGYVTGV